MKKTIVPHYIVGKKDDELIGHIGFGGPVEVDKNNHKKVLLTAEHSYIGNAFVTYAKEHYRNNFTFDLISTRTDNWKENDFSSYDIIYHVAGLAHADIGNISEEVKVKYYEVNTNLTIALAKKAKVDGVKEFIFMSSMIVYGDSAPYGTAKIIDEHTVPVATNFYGDSKLQADVALREMVDDGFKVIVIRPPMIYGKDSKGNYSVLSKLAKKMPVFPDVENERSMLYIDNLCEFLCQIMLVKEIKENSIVLIPQNLEWTRTSQMVKEIANIHGNNIKETSILAPAVLLGGKMPGKIGNIVNKAFGNNCYAHAISVYPGIEYQQNSLRDSIVDTESKKNSMLKKKRVLFLVNHDVVIYNFRLELVERLLNDGYEVHISSPYGKRIDELKDIGAVYHRINVERHGMNPIHELKLLLNYRKLIAEVKPDIILGYTIKPNIYGAMTAAEKHIPFVANITGLGTSVENPGMSQKLMVELYKMAFKHVQKVFFQNTENQQFFIDHNIVIDKYGLLPGSGVNLSRFTVASYPSDDIVKFAFISRIMKEKGIDQYLDAAKVIKKKYPNTEFHVCGFCEAEYEGKLKEYNDDGTVIYHGMIRDVAGFMSGMNCVIHPTYYPEGLSNVLLESCACGRPIITTDRSGCKEVVDDGINGYMIPQKNIQKLIEAIEKFIRLSFEEKRAMGLAARDKVVREFDRNIVVEAYMKEIER